MLFDDMMAWLFTAMGITAMVFLFWTFAAVVRTSRSALASGSDSGQPLATLSPPDTSDAA